jgi:hypothetical protein
MAKPVVGQDHRVHFIRAGLLLGPDFHGGGQSQIDDFRGSGGGIVPTRRSYLIVVGRCQRQKDGVPEVR